MKNKNTILSSLLTALLPLASFSDTSASSAEPAGETSLPVSVGASLAFDSKFMSYGLVDNNDPILTPAAEITFADTLTFGVSAIFDTTPYGRKHGEYTNRGGKYIELDPSVSLGHAFSPEDIEWLPTTVELTLGYAYEYHPKTMGHSRAAGDGGAPTQFVSFEVGLPDLPLEPHFSFERDIMRDDGTYVNIELGHDFALIDGSNEEEDPALSLRLSAAQGFGNAQRVKGYLSKSDGEGLNHSGLMDTCLKSELTWHITEDIALSGYVAYYDFLFDGKIRDAARDYEASGRHDTSYSFVGGLALSLAF